MLQNYGSARRSGDLFSNKSWLAVTKKAMQKSIKGVANVYTQHTPYLAATLEAISKGLLSRAPSQRWVVVALALAAPQEARRRSGERPLR